MRSRCIAVSGPALALLMALPASGSAQVRASELATVSQTIDGTIIAIEYSRPRARGRDSLFGGVVHWGEHWTPGANWATTFEVNNDVMVNGLEVPAGKYSMWMVVQPEMWVVYLDPAARKFHTDIPDSSDAQIRFEVVPQEAPYMEVMTMWFPDVTSSGATLGTQWGSTYVPLEISVSPSRPLTLASDKAQPYLGTYQFTWAPEPGSEDDGGEPRTAEMELYYENGSLMARMQPAPPWFRELVLIEVAEDWFNPGILDEDGKLYDVMTGLTMEFSVAEGQVNGFDLRWITDDVIGSAERTD